MSKHAVMSSSLAKALIESGVRHYDSGGTVSGGIGGALTPQNEYQASAPAITTQNLTPAVATAQDRATQVYQQQQNLAQALLSQSQGGGPNPAIDALNTQTGNNIAGTAALMASNRGANQNAGLIARQAARQGAATQQASVGQAATLKAQQQLAAQNALAGVYGTQGSNALQEEGINQSAIAAQNSALTTGQLGAAQINASTAQNNANNSASTTGGIIGGIGAVLGLSDGGEVPEKFADGGIASYATPVDPRMVLNINSTSKEGDAISKMIKKKTPKAVEQLADPTPLEGGPMTGLQGDAMASPLPTGMDLMDGAPLMLAAAHGGAIPTDFRTGGDVPGKAKVAGDSEKNDIHPALLSSKEIVLPRSVTMAPDAPERAKAFVEALRERKGSSDGYGKILKAKASLKDRVAHLEKLCGGGVA